MPNVKIDHSATLVGRVRLGTDAYVAQGSVLRSNSDSLMVGNASWILENSVLIGTEKHPLAVGSKTIFGHKCIAIGASIGNLCEIGNGAMFLPGSKVGDLCIFGEGTLIPPGHVVPSGSVVVGRPGRVIRKLTSEDRDLISRMRGGSLSLDPHVENVINREDLGGKTMGNLYEYEGKYPVVPKSALVYESAEITGDVIIGENTVIASGVRIIGNSHGPVRIGANVQILENTVLHLLPDNKLIIEDNVTIGPGCIIHGTHIGAGSVIESGSVVCDYSRLGKNTLVKAGSLVKQRSVFEDHQILEGFPAKPIGKNKQDLKRPEWIIR